MGVGSKCLRLHDHSGNKRFQSGRVPAEAFNLQGEGVCRYTVSHMEKVTATVVCFIGICAYC